MFKKQTKKAILLLAGLSLAFSAQFTQPIAQPITICPLCIRGYKCINGKCVPDPTLPQPDPITLHPFDPIDPCYPQVSSPAGCIESCQSSRFANCPDIFPRLYNPRFCGYNQKQNKWLNYTYDCQACKNPDIVGVINSKCSCSFTKCQSNQSCNLQTGQCQPIKIQLKCSTNPPNKVDCKVRPTKQECPNIFYFRAPDLVFCGIDRDGNKRGFARSCQVCLDKYFGSYYQAPCDQVPQIFCQDYQFCSIQGVCVDRCATIKCKAGYQCKKGQCIPIKCKNDKDCQSNEFCNVDYCIDKCAVVKCSDGYTCINGKCQPNQKQPKCSSNPPNKVQCKLRPTKQKCPDLVYKRAPDLVFCGVDKHGKEQGFARSCQVCLNSNFNFYYQSPCDQLPQITCKQYELCTSQGICIDKCSTIKCKAGYQCKKGKCIPIKPPKPDCSLIDCKPGYKCEKGQCIQIDKCHQKCLDYQRCFNGQCVDQCQFLKCANCYHGQCGVIPIPKCSSDTPTKIDCPKVTRKADCPEVQYIRAPDLNYCGVNGKGAKQGFARACQVCLSEKYESYYQAPCDKIPQNLCKDYQFCTIQGNCVDKCAAIRCQAGYQCKKGQCRKIVSSPINMPWN